MIAALRADFHRRLRRRASHLAGRVAPHLPMGATVLDIGSGTGHNAEALRARGEAFQSFSQWSEIAKRLA